MKAKQLPPSRLISAIRANHLGGVMSALDNGADIEEADVHGHAGLPLRTACFEGNQTIVVELLKRGADPNASAADGASAPLRLALRRGHTEVAAMLIQHGARPTQEHSVQAPAATRPREADGAPKPASTAADNLIEYTPSGLTFEKPGRSTARNDEAFGTATNALSADLLFLEEDEVPPIAWESKVVSN